MRKRRVITALALLLVTATSLLSAHSAAALSLPNINTLAAASTSSDAPTQVATFVQDLTKAITGLGVVVSGLFVTWGGITYSTSSASPERMEKAKKTVIVAIVGLVVCLAGFAIANYFGQLAQSVFGS